MYSLIDVAGDRRHYDEDVRLNKAQKKEWRKHRTITRSITYWPKNDDDEMVYIPFRIHVGFTKFEKDCIKTAFHEIQNNSRIR